MDGGDVGSTEAPVTDSESDAKTNTSKTVPVLLGLLALFFLGLVVVSYL